MSCTEFAEEIRREADLRRGTLTANESFLKKLICRSLGNSILVVGPTKALVKKKKEKGKRKKSEQKRVKWRKKWQCEEVTRENTRKNCMRK